MDPLNKKTGYHKDDSPREESVVGIPSTVQMLGPYSDDGLPTLFSPVYPFL